MFDNVAEYGQFNPPQIEVDKIQVPVMLVVAENDKVADYKDNLELS